MKVSDIIRIGDKRDTRVLGRGEERKNGHDRENI